MKITRKSLNFENHSRSWRHFVFFTLFLSAIMVNWAILAAMRLIVHTNQDLEHFDETCDPSAFTTASALDDCRKAAARNSNETVVYMTLFSLQIIILYCRIALIWVRSKELGPFIRMIGGMLDDILNFTFVALIFFLGFVQAVRYVVAEDIGEDVCSEDADLEVDLNSWYAVMIYVFVTLMGQQEWSAVKPGDACNISTERQFIAELLVIIFSILGTLLLLNLLIALMATTYDDKLEVKSKEVNFARTEETYELAHRQAIIPPPLNIFVFVVFIAWYLMEGKCCIYCICPFLLYFLL